ncbi:hypothetical protein [uncultured Desulfosarcina sp.]|uniref:hypothetical protein n=1 Tax=uncultured Desulfosarcina sp. TaxID=218289 RepID=UPI0029C6BAEF|nr:hypothetical protein [uncultured Desulfosarcina sp.]
MKKLNKYINTREIIDRVVEVTGWTKTRIAKDIFGIDLSNLGNRIRADRLDFYKLLTWALHTGVNVEWLVTGEQNNRATATVSVTCKDDFETANLMEMAQQVVQSDTIYSASLKTNIHSFHQAMIGEEKYKALEKELEEVGCKRLVSIDGARIRHDDPPQEKEEILQRRAF